MESNAQEYREVLVNVPVRDKNGNLIPFDSLSSGGARNVDGSLIVQYSNPRSPKSDNQLEADQKFDERLNRDYYARRRREEEDEERRYKENAEIFSQILNTLVLEPLMQKIVLPRATQFWDTKVLPSFDRLTQHRSRVKLKRSRVIQGRESTPDSTIDISNSPATMHRDTSSTSEVSPTRDDTPLADVIRLSDYQNRRSA